MKSPLPNLANAAALRNPEPPAGPLHDNYQLEQIMRQLHDAAAVDETRARQEVTKYKRGFHMGRADAKRHVISVLAQVKL